MEPASDAVKPNVGAFSLVVLPSAGPPVMVVSGGPVSDREGPESPGRGRVDVARRVDGTDREGVRTVRQRSVVNGVVHAANAAASRRHWNVEPASDAVKPNVGAFSFVVAPAGPPVMVVSGGWLSDSVDSSSTRTQSTSPTELVPFDPELYVVPGVAAEVLPSAGSTQVAV